ncbi:hypothetical protein L596_026965 [Steinernema carpocapsae]|uniref:Protein kinase domain-containing protein n=1 Tax=Steinernema carpocapsae TaxID=34508 RepID=A0A4U5M2W4_STECR|nr:hypothetical protein L596_026965 [Steinernema carpocapsae]
MHRAHPYANANGHAHHQQHPRDRVPDRQQQNQQNPRYSNQHSSNHQQNYAQPAQVPAALLAEADRQRVSADLLKYMSEAKFPYISDIDNYDKIDKIGQGTFGEVFKAKCKKTNRLVALKKILMENEKEGFPITALREIKMLQMLKHENVTELIEICGRKNGPQARDRCTFYLVFTFCDHDLAGLLSSKVQINLAQRKTLLKHLFNGLFTIHRNKILHRDMKAANVLIGSDGYLKLADFGLARPLFKKTPENPEACYTNRVVTLWYRPPELLLGERNYGPAIDMWGAGCIMAEFWTKMPIMQGDTEQKQLDLITQFCGSITPAVWPTCEKLPLYGKLDMATNLPRKVGDKLGKFVRDQQGLDLIEHLLSLDPNKRITASDALYHSFFYTKPLPNDTVKDLLSTLTTSMFEYTHGRGQQRGNPPPQQLQQHPRPPNNQYQDRCY